MLATSFQRLPLHDLHVARGGRIVPFAGYEMPVQYAAGVMKEHLHTRAACGLFDVSHMGLIELTARSGRLDDAARALERLVPQDIVGLAVGRQRYALFTNAAGGILDDLMVANLGDRLMLIVNAACKEADAAHLATHLADICTIEPLADRALIALQGPKAGAVLARLAPTTAAMRFLDAAMHDVMGVACFVSRSGYTGEDGFEIAIPLARAAAIVTALLDHPDVLPIGLGARDSLRLEAGLCLYGQDIGPDTTPVEAALEWSIQKARRTGGARGGGFPGADIILRQFEDGAPRRRVGLRPEGRAPVRGGASLFADATSGEPVGKVTSGGFGPTVNGPVAMGYVPAALASPGTRLFAEVRGQRHAVAVAALPFVPTSFKR
ncbi:MAG: glycine cleavage system aminomethyltransferase GcvT [Xanthobacteraceae bacterium]|nr:MAG: glycine cleavage system aminomethyltransferase GcvT [Xanthobacteraceae bacterium]